MKEKDKDLFQGFLFIFLGFGIVLPVTLLVVGLFIKLSDWLFLAR